jgi:endonuclease/exonuclease/phosphatase family metal-dependent hydrolase
MPSSSLRIATFNIHKGVNAISPRLVLHEQRELLRQIHADIVFLQEVCGAHHHHRHLPVHSSQHEFMADAVWPDFAYGKNASYPDGHHGNAILSKFPIITSENVDISAHAIEQRGLLHCEIAIPGWEQHLHAICVHFGLFSHWRRKQLGSLRLHVKALVPTSAPLIIAGDFNDWTHRAKHLLPEELRLKEVFEHTAGKPARSFPALLPMLRLDRIYTRGFHISHAEVHAGKAYAKVSDHAALSALLTRQ